MDPLTARRFAAVDCSGQRFAFRVVPPRYQFPYLPLSSVPSSTVKLAKVSTEDDFKTKANKVKKKSQWVFKVPENYSRECEVTAKFAQPIKRGEIYQLLTSIKMPLSAIEGIVQRPGSIVDFTVENKKGAIKLANALEQVEGINSAIAHGDEHAELTVSWVPPNFPQESIREALASLGISKPATYGRDRTRQKKDGRRIFTVKKALLREVKPPSFIYFGHYRFMLNYEGQKKTCSRCAEDDHIAKVCPYRQQRRVVTSQAWESENSKTTRASDQSSDESSPMLERPYIPCEETFPKLDNPMIHSTPNEDKSKTGNKNINQEIDHFDGSIRETKENRSQLTAERTNKGLKRRERDSGSSQNSTKDKPPSRKHKDDEDTTDNSDEDPTEYSIPEEQEKGTILCECNNLIPKPVGREKTFCHSCKLVYYRCNCIENNEKCANSLRQKKCDNCDHQYVPDATFLNTTIY
ncbi:unnamed protein product [Clavelina lepadiformis]|uniref:Gag-like protein n=1 Tax=Clavelina lepadiformis TaxID=159417 RepID=A0ABP0GF00_CLALP